MTAFWAEPDFDEHELVQLVHDRASVEVMAEVLNVFDTINFNHSTNYDNGQDTFRVTSAYTDINNTFDPGGRLGQLVLRLNW